MSGGRLEEVKCLYHMIVFSLQNTELPILAPTSPRLGWESNNQLEERSLPQVHFFLDNKVGPKTRFGLSQIQIFLRKQCLGFDKAHRENINRFSFPHPHSRGETDRKLRIRKHESVSYPESQLQYLTSIRLDKYLPNERSTFNIEYLDERDVVMRLVRLAGWVF